MRRSILACLLGANLAVAGLLGLNAEYLVDQYRRIQPFSYLSGEVSRAEHIARFRPEYPVYQYANEHIAQDARVLAIFLGRRRYYLHREAYFNPEFFGRVVEESRTPQEIAGYMRDNDVTHLMIRLDLFKQWLERRFPEEKRRLAAAFLKRKTKRLFQNERYILLRLEGLGPSSSLPRPGRVVQAHPQSLEKAGSSR
jgi:hypothetical protein